MMGMKRVTKLKKQGFIMQRLTAVCNQVLHELCQFRMGVTPHEAQLILDYCGVAEIKYMEETKTREPLTNAKRLRKVNDGT